MKCIIPGENVKILARAIHALAKIGDEIYVSPQKRSLSFRATGRHNVAYCDFTFNDNFFSSYNYGNLTEEDALKCKIPMRAMMTVFKTPVTLDKLIETCHIKLEPEATKLTMILRYKNSVVKRYRLPIIDCEGLEVNFDKDNGSNKITVAPNILTGALSNFQQSLHEITLDISPDKILIRNYVNDTCNTSNATRTQLALAVGEFSTYRISRDACITFCLKEVRAMLAFAEIVGNSLNVTFESAGTPVVFLLKNSAFEGNLVLVTLNPDCDYSYDTSMRARRRNTTKRTTTPKTKSRTTKPAKPKRSVKTVQTINSILARNSSRTTGQSEVTDLSTFAEPELISAVRSTSISSKMTTSESLRASPQHPHTPSPSGKKTHPIFMNSLKRQEPIKDTEDNLDEDDDNATVPGSPPAKKAKIIFKKCFNTSFDPRMLPGHDILLADNSDDEQPVVKKGKTR